MRIKVLDLDKEFNDTELSNLNETEEKAIEDALANREEYEDEELKEIEHKRERIKFIGKMFRQDEHWASGLEDLKSFKVIKYPRIMQSVFYLLGYTREQICEKETNKLWWKIAKGKVSTMFSSRIFAYNPCGPKDSEFKRF